MAVWFTDPWRALKGHKSAQLQASLGFVRPPIRDDALLQPAEDQD